MDKFVKRVQSRFNRKYEASGLKVTKDDVRGAYTAIVQSDNPTESELEHVLRRLEAQFGSESPSNLSGNSLPEDSSLTISEPNIIEITPESNPDLWEVVQPPVEEPTPQPEPSESLSNLPSDSVALTKPEETKPTISAPSAGIIPQDQVKGMVASVFAGQPTEFTNQVTDYALQHSFENVRQIQEFLEQLRGMEFNLLVKTLEDHFTRRGSMLSVLDEVLNSQQQKDQENRTSFFVSFQTRLTNFQKEMESKLAKQSI